jgi:predicted RNA-binding Zn ribbon-like protein
LIPSNIGVKIIFRVVLGNTLFMPIKPRASKEWIDGFLFVGNQLALDLLNTKLVLPDGPKELLPDAEALVRWLIASGVLASQKRRRLVRKWSSSPETEAFLKDLRAFRERLRAVVIRWEAGLPVSAAFIAEVNALLKQHSSVIELRRNGAKLDRKVVFEPAIPDDVWAPLATTIAELLSDIPAGRVRKCESCIVHYYDSSKKGSRRWCSMNICGNKVKVAAYQLRKRFADK